MGLIKYYYTYLNDTKGIKLLMQFMKKINNRWEMKKKK